MAKQDYIDSIKELDLSTGRLRELKREMIKYHSDEQDKGMNEIFEKELELLIEKHPELNDVSLDVIDTVIDLINAGLYEKISVKEIRVPFSGFYQTIHDAVIEETAEMQVEDVDDLDKLDMRQAMIDYSKIFINKLGKEIEIDFVFADLESPREYNFETDKIFANITIEEINKMYEEVFSNETTKKNFRDKVSSHFAKRDGFAPNYSDDYNNWGDISTWDYNQLSILLGTYINNFIECELNMYDYESVIAGYVSESGELEIQDLESEEKIQKTPGKKV